MIRLWDSDFDFSYTLVDKKVYIEKNKNISIYDFSQKTSNSTKQLCVRYDKIDGFIKIHDKIRYLILFDE